MRRLHFARPVRRRHGSGAVIGTLWILPGVMLAAIWTARADDAGVNSIIRSLAPGTDQEQSVESGPEGEDSHYRTVIGGAPVYLDLSHSLEIEVYFGFNSTELDMASKNDLDELGLALESEALRPYRYLVSGNTDSRGSDEYNQRLSEQRAMAVRDYVLGRYDVPPDRLIAFGWGETRPKDPANPAARINRRVEVTLIASEKPNAVPAPPASGAEAGDASQSQSAETVDTGNSQQSDGQNRDAVPQIPAGEEPKPGTLQRDQSGNPKITW